MDRRLRQPMDALTCIDAKLFAIINMDIALLLAKLNYTKNNMLNVVGKFEKRQIKPKSTKKTEMCKIQNSCENLTRHKILIGKNHQKNCTLHPSPPSVTYYVQGVCNKLWIALWTRRTKYIYTQTPEPDDENKQKKKSKTNKNKKQ